MAWHSYYGNGYTAQSWPQSYREDNATEIAQALRAANWTDYAIAATLGNMQVESYINPGQFEHSYPTGTPTGGYGLVQWTPRTKFSNWAGVGWDSDWNLQIARLVWEQQNGEQWIPTSNYNISFTRYIREDGTVYSVEWLARAFFYNYERGAAMGLRQEYARNWLNFLQGLPPTPTPSGNLPKWLLFKIKFENERGVK